jgi:Tfp pilus assembly protein PilF/TolB-like protein
MPTAGPGPPGPKDLQLPAGRMVADRYRLEERLGSGGMGDVYRAWDTHMQRWVAVKQLKPRSPDDQRVYERLLREGRASSALDHPAIVKVHDVIRDDSGAFLIEELANGQRLREKLDRPFDLEAFYTLADDCVAALATAAAGGVVHCDLKPENIFVTEEGHARILDFGIARHFYCPFDSGDGTTQTAVGARLQGTPGYFPPELIAGQVPDSRSDIFSLGVIFYEMLSARHPFRRETVAATVVAVDRDTPAPPSRWNPAVPRELDRLVLRMLAKDPRQRPPTPQALLADLRLLIERHPDGARGRARAPRRARLRHALVGLAAVLAIGAGGWLVTRLLQGHDAAAAHVPYLVVETFRSLGEAAADEYLALGLTEAVRTRLAELQGIQIVDPADNLGIKLALEGAVQRSGDRVRITYRLVDRGTGVNLAGSMNEGQASDLFALQDVVTSDVAQALADAFHLGPLPGREARPTLDVTAYDCYLQARGYLQRPGDQDHLQIAADLFRRARLIDSRFTLALAGLGETYWKLYEETNDPDWARLAEETARQALSENTSLAEVHVSLGTILNGIGRPADAAQEFRVAIARDPRCAPGYLGLGLVQQGMGDYQAAEQTLLDAIGMRPGDWSFHSQLGGFYARQGRYAEAAEAFRRVVALTPDNARGYSNLGAVLVQLGDTRGAVVALERSLELGPSCRAYNNLAMAYRFDGRPEDAARMYAKALEINPHDYRVWGSLGSICHQLPGRESEGDSAFAQAKALAEQTLAVNPHDPELLSLLAQYQVELGDKAGARQSLERALAIAPDRADVLYYVSAAYEGLGDREAALAAVAQAVRAGYPASSWRKEPGLAQLVADPRFESAVAAAAGGETSK